MALYFHSLSHLCGVVHIKYGDNLTYFILSLFIFPYRQVSLLATENYHAFVSVYATG